MGIKFVFFHRKRIVVNSSTEEEPHRPWIVTYLSHRGVTIVFVGFCFEPTLQGSQKVGCVGGISISCSQSYLVSANRIMKKRTTGTGWVWEDLTKVHCKDLSFDRIWLKKKQNKGPIRTAKFSAIDQPLSRTRGLGDKSNVYFITFNK